MNRLLRLRPAINIQISRSYYFKFQRVKTPPLPEPRESSYIVGPYLKPAYLPTSYITEPLKPRDENEFDYMIYTDTKVEPEERKIQLLLIADVEGLGVAGQVVEISGASKLIALKKAVYYTPFAQKWYRFGPKTTQSASSALSPQTVRQLKTRQFKLPIQANVTEIQPWHISLTLRLAGCWCPVDAIESIETHDTHVKCVIRINGHERVEIIMKI